MLTKKTAVTYARAQENSESSISTILEQKKEMEKFAKGNNTKIIKSFEDLGSGKYLDRNGLNQLKRFSDKNKFDFVIATDPARIGRFQYAEEWEYYKKKYFKGKKFIFTNSMTS